MFSNSQSLAMEPECGIVPASDDQQPLAIARLLPSIREDVA